jgi:hypothetical protein
MNRSTYMGHFLYILTWLLSYINRSQLFDSTMDISLSFSFFFIGTVEGSEVFVSKFFLSRIEECLAVSEKERRISNNSLRFRTVSLHLTASCSPSTKRSPGPQKTFDCYVVHGIRFSTMILGRVRTEINQSSRAKEINLTSTQCLSATSEDCEGKMGRCSPHKPKP